MESTLRIVNTVLLAVIASLLLLILLRIPQGPFEVQGPEDIRRANDRNALHVEVEPGSQPIEVQIVK